MSCQSCNRIAYLRAAVQTIQQVCLTGPPQPCDDVAEIQWLAIRIRDCDVQDVFECFLRTDFRFANLLFQILIVTNDSLTRFVVAVIACIVSISHRRRRRCLLVRVLIVDVKLVGVTIYHFANILEGLRGCCRSGWVFVLSWAKNVNNCFHRAVSGQRHMLKDWQIVFRGKSNETTFVS